MNASKTRLNKRLIVSLILLVTSIMLPVSALITHLSQGTGMGIGLQSEQLFFLATHGSRTSHIWLHIHALFGILFVAACMCHVALNWRTLKSYLTGTNKET